MASYFYGHCIVGINVNWVGEFDILNVRISKFNYLFDLTRSTWLDIVFTLKMESVSTIYDIFSTTPKSVTTHQILVGMWVGRYISDIFWNISENITTQQILVGMWVGLL